MTNLFIFLSQCLCTIYANTLNYKSDTHVKRHTGRTWRHRLTWLLDSWQDKDTNMKCVVKLCDVMACSYVTILYWWNTWKSIWEILSTYFMYTLSFSHPHCSTPCNFQEQTFCGSCLTFYWVWNIQAMVSGAYAHYYWTRYISD